MLASSVISDLKRNRQGQYLFSFNLGKKAEQLEVVISAKKASHIVVSEILLVSGNEESKSIQDYAPVAKCSVRAEIPEFSDFISPKISSNKSRKRKGIILSGQCFMHTWVDKMNDTFEFCELVLQNNLSPLPPPERHNEAYDAHVVSLPLRSILPEPDYFKEITSNTISAAKNRLNIFFENSQKISNETGIPVLVCNYITPQKSTSGCLKGTYDLKKLIVELNNHLEQLIKEKNNCYLLDIESLASSFGKRFISEDIWVHSNHGSLLGNYGYNWDKDRIEKFPDFFAAYGKHHAEFVRGIWAEVARITDVIYSTDQIKLIAVDLDDTLWRGVLAEEKEVNLGKLIEGWPLGIIEALLNLKNRGILLAIASNNSLDVIEKLWDSVFRKKISLADFAVIKINWDEKAKKIGEIIRETNLSPANILFLDDNPRERERVRSVYPDVKIVEAPYYEWKRRLLWPPETTAIEITNESKNKTELIKQKIVRDNKKTGLSNEEYLSGLGLKLSPKALTSNEDSARAFELLNKTNQFNVAGKKYTPLEFQQELNSGHIYQFSCSDNTSDYGVISVVIVSESRIEQFVMSCRVFGLEIEKAIFAWIQSHCNLPLVEINLHQTDRNGPAQTFVKNVCATGLLCANLIKVPTHIEISVP